MGIGKLRDRHSERPRSRDAAGPRFRKRCEDQRRRGASGGASRIAAGGVVRLTSALNRCGTAARGTADELSAHRLTRGLIPARIELLANPVVVGAVRSGT